jgi:hypothetical protein
MIAFALAPRFGGRVKWRDDRTSRFPTLACCSVQQLPSASSLWHLVLRFFWLRFHFPASGMNNR